ncbi:DMT family transporter [Anaerolineales bacterium HSG6]|nr:DMT family transporter [Anaerolineales bacterium HSG6]MDM8530668.1 DMT family transporter [Anaerolineales bacterium HSG25]
MTTQIVNRKSISQMAFGALLLGATAISAAPILVRLSEVGPVSTAFWRMSFALPFFWSWMLSKSPTPRTTLELPRQAGFGWVLLTGLFFAADLTAWHWSLHFTTVVNSLILANCAPIFVTLGAWLFFRQPVTPTFLLGLTIAIVGAILLVGAGFDLNQQNWFGDLLAVLTAIFYASYILSIKQARHYFPTATVLGWSGLVASGCLLGIAFLSGEIFWATTLLGWLVLISLALIAQVGGQSLITYALAHLPAPFSSVTLLLQPVLATIFAWLILSESIGLGQAVGGVIVLSGIFLARQGSDV